jgi:hypothetical protein
MFHMFAIPMPTLLMQLIPIMLNPTLKAKLKVRHFSAGLQRHARPRFPRLGAT